MPDPAHLTAREFPRYSYDGCVEGKRHRDGLLSHSALNSPQIKYIPDPDKEKSSQSSNSHQCHLSVNGLPVLVPRVLVPWSGRVQQFSGY